MGQAKKRRPCPAVNRELTSAECGENRLSRYACPESCSFNPFAAANYSELLKAEDELDLLTMKRAVGEDAEIVSRINDAMRMHPAHGMHATMVWHLFFKRDVSDRTFAARWEQAGFPGLKNDQRTLFRGKAQMRVALLEVRHVLDDRRFEAVDLLDATGTPRVFVDRSTTARATRFFTILTWIYPLPHFWRMSGTGIPLSDLGPFTPREMLDASIAHLGGPAKLSAQPAWLAENFVRTSQSLAATGLARRRQMFSHMDVMAGSATYELQDSFMACRSALAADPSVDREDITDKERGEGFAEAVVWFEKGPMAHSAMIPGRRILGRVLLGLKEWRVEAMSGASFDELRRRFEARLGKRVRFVKERRDNLAEQMAAKDPASDLSLVPPKLLEKPNQFAVASSQVSGPPPGVAMGDYEAELWQQQQRAWLDEKVPALNGQTPRSAARQPELRGQLIELVKAQVRRVDERNLKLGRADDANGLIRELGLTEIDFPPPPPRLPPDDEDEFEPEYDGDEEADFPGERSPIAITGWSAPPLGKRPLSEDESVERLERGMSPFEMAADAITEIEASGATVLEDAYDLVEGVMGESDFSYFTVFVVQVWFALVPLGGNPPSLRYEVMEAAVDRDFETLQGINPTQILERLLADSPQPKFLHVVMAEVMGSAEKAPKKIRPKPDAVIGMVLVLKALIAEIDYALRQS